MKMNRRAATKAPFMAKIIVADENCLQILKNITLRLFLDFLLQNLNFQLKIMIDEKCRRFLCALTLPFDCQLPTKTWLGKNVKILLNFQVFPSVKVMKNYFWGRLLRGNLRVAYDLGKTLIFHAFFRSTLWKFCEILIFLIETLKILIRERIFVWQQNARDRQCFVWQQRVVCKQKFLPAKLKTNSLKNNFEEVKRQNFSLINYKIFFIDILFTICSWFFVWFFCSIYSNSSIKLHTQS